MNILYVNFSFKVGGIERLLIDIVNTMSKDKKNNIYLCIINKSYDESLLQQINKNVKVVLLNRPVSGNKLKYLIQYTKLILQNDIDVVHCQIENAVKFSVLAKILKPNLKVFTTIHDTKIFLNLSFIDVLIDKIMCKKIIAISEAVKKEILERGISENKVKLVYNAIDINKFSKTNLNKKDIKNQIVIGNVSRLMPSKKGQDILIRAIAKLKRKYSNIVCLLAGGSATEEPDALDELKELCVSLDVTDNIKFLGNINDVSKFLDKIDIFVLPSRYEGFGISLIEAMAKGVPCIASDIDGPKELIKDNRYGLLFKSEDYSDLSKKLEYRINNMNVNKNFIKRYLNKNFEIVSMSSKLMELYTS